MKKFYILLTSATIGLVACENVVDSPVMLPEGSEIETLIGEQNGVFDDSGFELMLGGTVLESFYYENCETNDSSKQHKRVVFNEDGTCSVILHTTKEGTDVYYHSRTFVWDYDEQTKSIVTTDEYGNVNRAQILYLDGEKFVYQGVVADHMQQMPYMDDDMDYSRYRTIAYITRDYGWDDKETLSFDVEVRCLAAKDDARLNKMYELIEGANGEVDDDLVVESLHSKVLYFGRDLNGVESGCTYGDIGIYYIWGDYVYWTDTVTLGGAIPSTYVLLEDGTCRDCFVYDELGNQQHPLWGKKCYLEDKWSYDAENNMLYIGDSSAEVLYCDDAMAILKGKIDGYPQYYDYALIYVDFTKLDRDATLEEYDELFSL